MKHLTILFLLLIFSLSHAEEAFFVKNFHVKIQVNMDGSLDITEQIDVFFKEKRHGIIRDIPYLYKVEAENAAGEKAIRPSHVSNGLYQLLFKKIKVYPDNFSVSTSGSFKSIQIGDAYKWVNGDHSYTIKYKVWGAINRFTNHIEIPWNVTGNQWDCDIEKASATIILPKAISLKDSDLIVFTGYSGSKESKAKSSIGKQQIIIKTENLNNYEGLTFGLRLPSDYLKNTEIPLEQYAETFYFKNHSIDLFIQDDAGMKVVEKMNIRVLTTTDTIRKKMLRTFDWQKNIKSYKYRDFTCSATRGVIAKYDRNNDHVVFTNAYKNLNGEFQVELHYTLYGAVQFDGILAELIIPVINEKGAEPMQTSRYAIHFPKGVTPDTSSLSISAFNLTLTKPWVLEKNTIHGVQENITSYPGFSMMMQVPKNIVDRDKINLVDYAYWYWINDLKTTIKITPDGKVNIRQVFDAETHHSSHFEYFTPEFALCYPAKNHTDDYLEDYKTYHYYDDYSSYVPETGFPDYSIFNKKYYPLITNTKTNCSGSWFDEFETYGLVRVFRPVPQKTRDTFEIEYSIVDLFQKKNGKAILQLPVFLGISEPVRKASLEIILEKGNSSQILQYKGYIEDSKQNKTDYVLVHQDNTLIGSINNLLKNEVPVVEVTLSGDYLTIPIKMRLELLLKNNPWLAASFIIFVFLFILWFLFGRDRRSTLMVQYFPPKDVTPAEAGYLWDFKLHKRDLISLIFYWADKGYLSIKEIKQGDKESDYQLTKEKELPSDAKPFEHTMFKGLFGSLDTIKISGLRNSFYITMKKAFRELKKYSRSQRFFSPGTLGFSRFLKFISYLLFSGVIIAWEANRYEPYWEIILSLLISGVSFFFFGKIMTRYGHFGAEKYNELRGFREFIEKAEIEKLRTLVHDNPSYFYETMSYATVMGLSNSWSKKFETINLSPPSFIRTDGDTIYDSTMFSRMMLRSMHRMDRDMHYKQPSSNSYRSGSSSSFRSSSFRSSFRSSSGSGFSSFSRGSSGGGFGGGGGRSW